MPELPDWITVSDRRIRLRVTRPAGNPAASIQVLHGLAEHGARYTRFADEAAARGYLVVAQDHRGHGPDCPDGELGHYADRHGWDKVVADVAAVNAAIRQQLPDVPTVLLGHSMGSFIAQSFCMRHPDAIDALLLSGSNWPKRTEVRAARALAWLIGTFRGKRSPATLLDRLSFGNFNDAFSPNRTRFDWLSRDTAEVDRYIADPLCGFVASNGLWFDFLGGILEVSRDDAIARLPAGLPVLIFGGELDPVGGARGLTQLADRYRTAGLADVELVIYPDGRHEMLNEINRDQVTADVLDWIDRILR